jgi:uncharacterized protein YecT (DUF1311 family)
MREFSSPAQARLPGQLFGASVQNMKHRHRSVIIGILIASFPSLTLRTVRAAGEPVLPPHWQPSLTEVEMAWKSELESKKGTGLAQQQLNELTARLSEVYDAELFITYMQLFAKLGREGRRQLFREQQRWLRKRAAQAGAQVQSRGGSLAALEYNGAFNELTNKRIAQLRQRLKVLTEEPQRKQP